MITVMLIGFLVGYLFMITTENLLQFSSHVNVYSILGLLVFMLGSSLFHELGHALPANIMASSMEGLVSDCI